MVVVRKKNISVAKGEKLLFDKRKKNSEGFLPFFFPSPLS